MQITNSSALIAALALFLCIPLVACRQQVNTATDSVQAVATPVLTTQEAIAPETLVEQWIVNADEARLLIEQGASVLDTRTGLYVGNIEGAVSISWKDFSPADSTARGNLLTDDAEVSERLQAHGISTDRPVVVFGNPPRGWGEDGRIVWMLRSLGHTQAVMVDGGFQALTSLTEPVSRTNTPPNSPFQIRRNNQWSIEKETLRAMLNTENLVIIDTREPREFAGGTPYGEQRGGHIPGAVHLYFKDLLADNGELLPLQTITNKLEALNITPDAQIVVYCTGGIRSGWLVAVLTTLGYQAQNYAGSMWEWSAAPASEYPLDTNTAVQ